MTTTTRADTGRAVGALLSAAVGDALGWPQEVRGGIVGGQKTRDQHEPKPVFISWTRNAGYYKRRYPDRVNPGEYSDDTQLLLAVARACMTGDNWYERLTAVELPTWPLYQRGGGGAVLAATGSWAETVPPWVNDGSSARAKTAARYARAGANGVAMRIAPHVICATSEAELLDRVLRDGLTTHGHPRALVGALVYAFGLRAAFDASDPLSFGELLDAGRSGLISSEVALGAIPSQWLSEDDLKQFAYAWDQTNRETEELLSLAEASIRRGAMSNPEKTLESLGCTDPKINGAGTVSAVGALYVASRFAARPLQGLLTAAFLRKGDTDTLASMTGALLGAVHGSDWLAALAHSVQDSDYISKTAVALVERSGHVPPAPSAGELRQLRKQWHRGLSATRIDSQGVFPDGRQYRVSGFGALGDSELIRVYLRFDDGQSVIHDLRQANSSRSGKSESHLSKDIEPQRSDRDVHIATKQPETAYQVKDLSIRPAGMGAVTALTNNLHRTVAFYARLLEREIPVHGDEATITEWFRLRRAARELHPGEAAAAGVTLYVASPSAVTKELAIEKFDQDTGTTIVRDPDGRNVFIRRASVDQRSETRPRSHEDNRGTLTESAIPSHVFGDLADEFYAAVGRTGTLSSLLEDKMRVLLQAMEHEPQTSYAGQGATALVTMAWKRASSMGDDWKGFDEFATRADTALRLRNDLLHNLWQPKPGGQFFGHRTDQRTGERRSTTVSVDDIHNEVAELLALNEEWRHWYTLAGSRLDS